MARQRGIMSLIGALAGLGLYLLFLVIDAEWIGPRVALAAITFLVSLTLGLMTLSGPLGLGRAIPRAAGMGALLAALLSFAALRFATPEGLSDAPLTLASLAILLTLPWPFLVTAAAPEGWRDYPGLFRESWSILVRLVIALLFAGLLWLTLFLCDEILGLAGLHLLSRLLDWPPAPWLVTGATLGLAVAVVDEIAPALSPALLLRLLRLLLPLVLVVTALFLVTLPIHGFGAIFGLVSSAGTLLCLSALAVTLVTSAIDEDDLAATSAPLMRRATRALAVLALVPAGLAAWALALRVMQHGWTPGRFMAATVTLVLVGYGLAYVAACPRRDWMERIRQANIVLALGQIALAVLWMTVLNPEALSVRSQMARLQAGVVSPQDFDINALGGWGVAGAEAQAKLAADPAFAGLAQPETPPTPAEDRLALQKTLVLRPDTAETQALRDRILEGVADYELVRWRQACARPLPEGGAGCVLAFADFLPAVPGPEALLVTRDRDGYVAAEGFSFPDSGLARHAAASLQGLPDATSGPGLIARLQNQPLALAPVALNQLQDGGLFFAP